jgi:hypothetical protein
MSTNTSPNSKRKKRHQKQQQQQQQCTMASTNDDKNRSRPPGYDNINPTTLSNPVHFNNSNQIEKLFETRRKNRTLTPKKSDIRVRYWSYLFDNFKRAIDEIYHTCESDESISECQDVIMMLDNCTNDFGDLMMQIKMSKEFKNQMSDIQHLIQQQHRPLTLNLDSNQRNAGLLTGFQDFIPQIMPNKSKINQLINKSNYIQKSNGTDGDDENDDITNPMDLFNNETFSETSSQAQTPTSPTTTSSFLNQSLPEFFHPPPTSSTSNYNKSLFNQPNNYNYYGNSFNGFLLNNNNLNTNFGINKLTNNVFSLPYQQQSETNNLDNSMISVGVSSIFDDSFPSFYNNNNNNDKQQSNQIESSVDHLEKEFLQKNSNSSSCSSKMSLNNNSLLKVYELEEKKANAIEKKQNKKLLSVLVQEAKLNKQLSVEKFIQLNHHYQFIRNNEDDDDDDDEGEEEEEEDDDEEDENDEDDGEEEDDELLSLSTQTTTKEGQKFLFEMKKKYSKLRKMSPTERRRLYEEKQTRAREKREQFYHERSNKLKEIAKKIDQVRDIKNKLLKSKKIAMKTKLQRAETKRQYLLSLKAMKASVEEQKAHEIAFINNLAAQNRRHDILERYEKRYETIKQNIEEERMRRQDEQKAKELAAESRRKELETQRMNKLDDMLKKRRMKQSKIEQSQLHRERERLETARAKEKTREKRLANIAEQFEANKEEVKKRIEQKQEQSSRRHECQLDEIRKKANEMISSSSLTTTTTTTLTSFKYCNACCLKITISSTTNQLDVHIKSKQHEIAVIKNNQGKSLTKSEIDEYNSKCIVEFKSDKTQNDKKEEKIEEKRKQIKKKIKKLTSKGVEFEIEFKNQQQQQQQQQQPLTNSKIVKILNEIEKCLTSSSNDCNNNKLIERNSNDLYRAFKTTVNSVNTFKTSNGVSIVTKTVQLIHSNSTKFNGSYRLVNNLINILLIVIKQDNEMCTYMILSNCLITLLTLINDYSSQIQREAEDFNLKNKSQELIIFSNLLQLIEIVIINENENDNKVNSLASQRLNDLINLLINYGLIDTFSLLFESIRGPLRCSSDGEDGSGGGGGSGDEWEKKTIEIIQNSLNLLISIVKFQIKK